VLILILLPLTGSLSVMIERYSRSVLSNIWSDQSRYEIWLKVELLALEGMSRVGLVPAGILEVVQKKASFEVPRILEIEDEVKHDVIAFLTNVVEHVGPEARYLHRGMTSNDLLDTTFAVQLSQAGALIAEGLDKVLAVLEQKARQYKDLVCIGRSHGIHAEPITYGLKFASWHAELQRRKQCFKEALAQVKVGKLAGAVGTYASLPPEVEKFVMDKLGLEPERCATQVVARDRHAQFFLSLAQIGSSIERFCVEIRHLQRTEVAEVEEAFGKGQKGSSAMPHKKNPILSENLTGLARLLRGYAFSSLENVPLWHERDISHSSVERVVGPDATILTDFMLHRFSSLVEGLIVNEGQVERNLNLTGGLIFSGTLLVQLTDKGMTREDAYRIVQKHALDARNDPSLSFRDRVATDKDIKTALTEEELNQIFGISRHLAHIDTIFDRVFT